MRPLGSPGSRRTRLSADEPALGFISPVSFRRLGRVCPATPALPLLIRVHTRHQYTGKKKKSLSLTNKVSKVKTVPISRVSVGIFYPINRSILIYTARNRIKRRLKALLTNQRSNRVINNHPSYFFSLKDSSCQGLTNQTPPPHPHTHTRWGNDRLRGLKHFHNTPALRHLPHSRLSLSPVAIAIATLSSRPAALSLAARASW